MQHQKVTMPYEGYMQPTMGLHSCQYLGLIGEKVIFFKFSFVYPQRSHSSQYEDNLKLENARQLRGTAEVDKRLGV